MSEPLRVLVAHNAYQQRGGEDAVAEAEMALLRSRGHEVQTYWRSNVELQQMGRVDAAVQAIWSRRTTAELGSVLAAFKPDLIHVHNTMPLISPSLYWVAQRAGVPVVQTLHNYRLLCPQATLLREGRVCEDCVGKLPWRAVAHRCYRDSAAQSGVLALMLSTHRALGTWRGKVDRYIALTEFARAKFVQGGLPADRISVKANFVDIAEAPPAGERDGFLYVGRLSQEKGIAVLMEAFKRLPPGQVLRVVGEGPLAPLLQGIPGVEHLGALSSQEVYDRMRRARALLLPSICHESYPRTVVEAFACGLPVLASALGALPGIVDHGRTGQLFAADDAQALADCMAAVRPDELAVLGAQARQHYLRTLTPEINYAQLMEIYRQARAAP